MDEQDLIEEEVIIEDEEDVSSSINELIKNLTDTGGLEKLLYDNRAKDLSEFLTKIDKTKLLHLQALIRSRAENSIAIEEANVYRSSINYYGYCLVILGVLGSLIAYLWGDKIISYCTEKWWIRWSLINCSIGFFASPISSFYRKIKNFFYG